MCGICGIYNFDRQKNVDEKDLRRMASRMVHRGPDDEGYSARENCGIGARRLSIIDIAGGSQPVRNEQGDVQVVLNGEIYNYLELREFLIARGHAFKSRSDTEVIAHLYEDFGPGCLHYLRGMFAFAVMDTARRSMLVARDHMGVKPLYYFLDAEKFVFASEIKAVMAAGNIDDSLDIQALRHFFSLNYVPTPYTPFKKIRQLSAGHYMSVSWQGTSLKEYWDIPRPGESSLKEREIAGRIESLLDESTRFMLRSDVALGAFLSGGMDSSTLVSFVRRNNRMPLKTFSVGFDEPSYDETEFAAQTASFFGTDHYRAVCRPRDVVDMLPRIVSHADNLIADPAMVPMYLLAAKAREHVTVCLSGDGGDELFAGYATYLADIYMKAYGLVPSCMRGICAKAAAGWLPVSDAKLSFDYKVKKFCEGACFSRKKAHYWWRTIFNEEDKNALLADAGRGEDSYSVYDEQYQRYMLRGKASLYDMFGYADMKVWLADNNLSRVDAMSMAHSLEVRVPFLDHKLVECMAQVPFGLKVKNGELKHLLKKVMSGKLPGGIIARKKAGWHVPLAGWFKKELRSHTADVFSSSRAFTQGFLNRSFAQNLVYDHIRGKANNAFKIWGLLIFCYWYDNLQRK